METDFESFKQKALAEGCQEVLERRWPAGTLLEEHTHPFEANALVAEGEMWLTVGDETRRLLPGDRFHIAAGVPHSERYGPEGAAYWVGRR